MDRANVIANAAEEIIRKSYQIQGCVSSLNLTTSRKEDMDYLTRTMQEVRELGSRVKRETDYLKPEIRRLENNSRSKQASEKDDQIKKMRKELADIKKKTSN